VIRHSSIPKERGCVSDLLAAPALSLAPERHGRASGAAGVRVREIKDRGLVLVAARKQRLDALAELFHRQLGIVLPDKPLLARGQRLSLLWGGFAQWLAMDNASSASGPAHLLDEAIGDLASLTDQSDARAILEVSGHDINQALAKLVPIDLHPRVFRGNDTAMTLFGHIAGQLTKIDEAPTYEIMIPRSFAESFWRALAGAGAEFGVEVI
jgi:methylglutamate dehydrogenase subunit D